MSGPRHGVVEHVSSLAFGPTLQRLKDRIASAGMTVFACIDHAAGAREVGMGMPPTVVLFYGHARGGTPIMLAAPQAALDLPLRVLAREDTDGRTVVSFRPVAQMLREAGVPDPLASRIEPAQQILVDAIATA